MPSTIRYEFARGRRGRAALAPDEADVIVDAGLADGGRTTDGLRRCRPRISTPGPAEMASFPQHDPADRSEGRGSQPRFDLSGRAVDPAESAPSVSSPKGKAG